MATQDNIETRRNRLMELLGVQGVMTLAKMSAAMDLSVSTLRRDLETLEQQGLLRRTHGGAILEKHWNGQNTNSANPGAMMAAQKKRIAAMVAGTLQDGQTVILDGGTTCFEVAAALPGRRMSVVTNSVPIAERLSGDLSTEVIVIGGYLYPRVGVALGPTAIRQLAEIRASVLVMSCAAVEPGGVYNTNQMMVDVERQMMKSSDRVILAVDSSKFHKRGLTKLCDLREIQTIVTDPEVPDEVRDGITAAGLKLLVV